MSLGMTNAHLFSAESHAYLISSFIVILKICQPMFVIVDYYQFLFLLQLTSQATFNSKSIWLLSMGKKKRKRKTRAEHASERGHSTPLIFLILL